MDKALIERIKKLLALGQSANANEAAAAMARAQELLARHSLTMEQLEASNREAVEMDAEVPLIEGARPPKWLFQLASDLSKHTGVYIYCHRYREADDQGRPQLRKRLAIVGKGSNIAAFRAMFHFAQMEFRRLSVKDCKGKGRAYATAWLIGAVTGLRSALAAARMASKADQAGLVTLDRARAEAEAFARALIKIKDQKPSSRRVNSEAYGQGMTAGRALRFHGGEVGAGRPTLAMGA